MRPYITARFDASLQIIRQMREDGALQDAVAAVAAACVAALRGGGKTLLGGEILGAG